MKMDLKDKVVIVTGASSGIGAAIAKQLAEQGAKITMVGRNESKLKDVSDICENSGSKPLVIVADVTKEEDMNKIVTDTINNYGKIDVLINNAAVAAGANITGQNAMEVFDLAIRNNLRSAVYLTHVTVPHLIETKGNIVNVSSIAAVHPLMTNNFPYSTAKAGLDHFTRCMALDLAPNGIRVNTVNPGPVKTDIISNAGMGEMEDTIYDVMKQSTALNRITDSGEIADLVLFLASDRARGITGSSLITDNGALLKGVMKF